MTHDLGQSARDQLASLSDKARRRVLRLVARSRSKSARLRWNSSTQGTYRNPMRELRRALLAEHCKRTGNKPTGRQWVRLRKRLARAARVGDQPELRAVAAAVTKGAA